MGGLSPSAIVETWERGAGARAHERAVGLLEAAFPETPVDDLVRVSVGARDVALLALRSELFGSSIDGTTICEGCGEILELVFDIGEIQAEATTSRAGDRTVERDGFEITFRLLDSTDLAAVCDARDVEEARSLLVRRCVLDARRDGASIATDMLPADVVDALDDALAVADPQGDMEIETLCPTCASRQHVLFDAGAFVWAEVDACARRLLREVHELASAYGWSESTVLELSAARRSYYLELAAE